MRLAYLALAIAACGGGDDPPIDDGDLSCEADPDPHCEHPIDRLLVPKLRAIGSGPRDASADEVCRRMVADGRAFLLRSQSKFDVIEADALRPTSAYSGNLYSEAYFALVKDRLTPNGLAATWAPTRRIHDTFLKVFPYVISVPGMMVGSNQPFEASPHLIRARLQDPAVRAHYEHAGIDITALMTMYVPESPVRFGPDVDRSTLAEINTDLFPRDEFDLAVP